MRRCRTRGLPLNSQVPAKHWFLVILFYSQESFSILFSIPVEIRGHVAHTASSVSGHSNEAWSSAAWQEFWEDSLCRLCRKDTNDAERLPLGWRYHWYSLIFTDIIHWHFPRSCSHTGKVWSPFQTPLRGRAAKCAESSSLLRRGAREIQAISFQIGTDKTWQNQRRPEVWYQFTYFTLMHI